LCGPLEEEKSQQQLTVALVSLKADATQNAVTDSTAGRHHILLLQENMLLYHILKSISTNSSMEVILLLQQLTCFNVWQTYTSEITRLGWIYDENSRK